MHSIFHGLKSQHPVEFVEPPAAPETGKSSIKSMRSITGFGVRKPHIRLVPGRLAQCVSPDECDIVLVDKRRPGIGTTG